MCIVIDPGVFHKVFNSRNTEYGPVYNWIFNKNGKMVFGGTHYSKELEMQSKYIPIIAELKRIHKVIVVDKDTVDDLEDKVKEIEPKKDFDDPHLVAIVEISGCRIVCSDDKRADKYIKDERFYNKSKKPSIYRTNNHSHLLTSKNIVAICK